MSGRGEKGAMVMILPAQREEEPELEQSDWLIITLTGDPGVVTTENYSSFP